MQWAAYWVRFECFWDYLTKASFSFLLHFLAVGTKKTDPSAAGRRMLEQRIAQLEQDAREQDRKAQLILANVQSRFSSVQSKYETHISDLETQVLR